MRVVRFATLLPAVVAITLTGCQDSAGPLSAPAPVITAITPDSALSGSDSLVIRVSGRGFHPETLVRFNGTAVSTRFIDTAELEATVPGSMLSSAVTAEITAFTPAPGGGASPPLPFLIIPPHPVITVLPSRGAAAGRPGFTLTLHGEHFGQGSAVRWNGVLRDATFLAPGRLSVAVSSADVAAPASVELSVVNVGSRESQPVTLRIRALGPAAGSVLRVPLSARDLVWDPGTGLLYVSVGGSGMLANTITAVDPNTGDVQKSVFIGSEPNRLARSDDGQFLYVGLDGANAIRRLALATFTPGLQWSLPAGQVAGDMEVAPGQPHVVAVSRNRTDVISPPDGVTIYDEGVPRATSASDVDASRIEFLESPDELYAYNDYTSAFNFYILAVNSSGVHHVRTVGGLISGFSTEIVGAAGRIYSSNGAVVDAGRGVRVGTAGSGHGVAADPETGRLFYVTPSGVAVYDMNTFQHLGTIGIMDLSYDATTRVVVRWGEDGLAFLAQDELVIVRSPIVGR